jgi:anthranilate phosphoribosyltransferase
MLVSGEESLDEISIAGPSRIIRLGPSGQSERRITPEELGIECHPLDSIRGGDPAFNAAALRDLLGGSLTAYRDAVLLNSAASLIVAEEVVHWADGVAMAAEAIDDGTAARLLDRWIAA